METKFDVTDDVKTASVVAKITNLIRQPKFLRAYIARRAEYCNDLVCLSVCLSAARHIGVSDGHCTDITHDL